MRKYLLLLLPCLFLAAALAAQAGYKLEVGIPGQANPGTETGLAQYIRYLYLFGLGAVGAAALGALVTGGFMYMLADSVTSRKEANTWIWSAIGGIIIALAAYLILNTINPDLLTGQTPNTQIPNTGGYTGTW